MSKKMILLFLFISIGTMFAQEFSIEYQKVEGRLTSQDLIQENFGRYDGYQLPLNKGETAYFIVYSDAFSPSLVFVTPDDKIYEQVAPTTDDFVAYALKVPKGGEWVLYVIGGERALGNYLLQYAFADSASLFINDNVDFCTGMNYLLAHATAYYLFPQTIPSGKPLFKFKDAIDSFINGDDASYNSSFYQGDEKAKAEKAYSSLIDKITSCVPNNWDKKNGTENFNGSGMENFIMWTEPGKTNARIIKVSLSDYSADGMETEYLNKYSVDMMIMRY